MVIVSSKSFLNAVARRILLGEISAYWTAREGKKSWVEALDVMNSRVDLPGVIAFAKSSWQQIISTWSYLLVVQPQSRGVGLSFSRYHKFNPRNGTCRQRMIFYWIFGYKSFDVYTIQYGWVLDRIDLGDVFQVFLFCLEYILDTILLFTYLQVTGLSWFTKGGCELVRRARIHFCCKLWGSLGGCIPYSSDKSPSSVRNPGVEWRLDENKFEYQSHTRGFPVLVLLYNPQEPLHVNSN